MLVLHVLGVVSKTTSKGQRVIGFWAGPQRFRRHSALDGGMEPENWRVHWRETVQPPNEEVMRGGQEGGSVPAQTDTFIMMTCLCVQKLTVNQHTITSGFYPPLQTHTHTYTHVHTHTYTTYSLQWQWRDTEGLGIPELYLQTIWGPHDERSPSVVVQSLT